ncbi:MAG TPA: DcaP family trimeric outer membrane transporter [Burkholderiaceae bacterium]|nr:DcaP family trimeric outer membrane transporter [Burkholderiaceae bacterium]
MNLKPTLVGLAAALMVGGAAPAFAQSSDIEMLKEELRKLRAEVAELKKAQAARPAEATGNWGDRIEQLELKAKDAVVGGDIGGSIRIPGSETSLRIYGHAEAQLIHDLKGTAPGDNFTNLMEQPLNGADAGFAKGKTKFTAQTSRFGFETATPTQYGTLNTKVEGDFYAYCGAECNRNRFRLRHAYGEYAGWLVGQTWSTFMDLDNLPETVDFNGPIGSPFSRRMMVRYTWADPKAGNKFTGALEDPEDGARLPNLVLRFDKSFDWGAVNVRVLAHEKRVGTESKRGTGFGVGGSYKLTGDDLLMFQWARVNGDYDMMYGSSGYIQSSVTGKLLFDKNDGAVFGWAHTVSPTLRTNVALGMNRSKATAEYVAEMGNYQSRRLTQLHAGFIYVPVKNVELGAEYIHGVRKTFDGDEGKMSRFDLMARYSF